MNLSLTMLLAMMATQGSVNDALDLVDSKTYWRQAKVEMTVDALAAQLYAKVDGETMPAAATRWLMAIRALGELKQKAALKSLLPLLQNKSPFVADYAKQAVSAIEGAEFRREEASREKLESDLALLPSGCGAVAQMRVPPGRALSWDTFAGLIEEKGPVAGEGGPDANAVREEMTRKLMAFLAKVGNFRLDAVTLGVSGSLRTDTGFIVLVARGLYDVDAVGKALKPFATRGVETVDGVDVFRLDLDLGIVYPKPVIVCPSNDRLILVMGGSVEAERAPLDQALAALKGAKGGVETDADMKALVNSVDRTKRLWAAIRPASFPRQHAVVAPFDAVTLVADDRDGMTAFTLVARGQDGNKAAVAAKLFDDARQDAIRSGKKEKPPHGMEAMQAGILDFFENIKVAQDGARVTLTAAFKGSSAVSILLPMVLVDTTVRCYAPPPAPDAPKPAPQDR